MSESVEETFTDCADQSRLLDYVGGGVAAWIATFAAIVTFFGCALLAYLAL